MGVSRSTYYAVPQDRPGSALKRESEAALRSAIENVVTEWSAYGAVASLRTISGSRASCAKRLLPPEGTSLPSNDRFGPRRANL
jgi:hypothetical protein